MGVQIESKLQNTGIFSTAAWSPRRLYYRPAVFLYHLRLTALSFPQRKEIGTSLKNVGIYLELF